eukprot:2816444-Amphidinium_carterae.1
MDTTIGRSSAVKSAGSSEAKQAPSHETLVGKPVRTHSSRQTVRLCEVISPCQATTQDSAFLN